MSNKGLTCHFLTLVALSAFAVCEEKPRIFIAKSDSWEINGGGGSYSKRSGCRVGWNLVGQEQRRIMESPLRRCSATNVRNG